MPDAEFHTSICVGNHRRTFSFGPCTRGGGNTNQLRKHMTGRQYRDVSVEIKLPHVAVIVTCQSSGLTRIHTAAATDGNDTIVPALAVGFSCQRNIRVFGIGCNFRKHRAFDSRVAKCLLKGLYERQLCRPLVRDDQRVGQRQSRCLLPQSLQTPGPVGNRHGKRPIVILQ